MKVRAMPLNSKGLTLADHYDDLHASPSAQVPRLVENIMDAVLQLAEARKNPRMTSQIKPRRETLIAALQDSIAHTGYTNEAGDFISSVRLKAEQVDAAVAAIDHKISRHISDAKAAVLREQALTQIARASKSAAQTAEKIRKIANGNGGVGR